MEFVRFNDVADLEAKFDDTVCAIVIEPIQGEGGIFSVSEEFWERARALATRHDAALIADEIQCGLGRTGRTFALPEISVASGYRHGCQTAGWRTCRSERLSPARNSPPALLPACTARHLVAARSSARRRSNFLPSSRMKTCLRMFKRGARSLRAGLDKLAGAFDFIREVRGEGLILGIDLSVEGAPFVQEALRQKLLINCTHEHILRLLPPFIIRQRDVVEFLTKFESCLNADAKSAAKSSLADSESTKHTHGR